MRSIMILLALKMMVGNRTSCLGVIFGIFLATLLISQQSAIFLGLLSRSYRMVTDIPAPEIWVMDPSTESPDKVRGIPSSYLGVMRGIEGVEWAAPLHLMSIPLVTERGKFDVCELYGVDDAMLIGAPTEMIEGQVRDLRREGAVIVDAHSAQHGLVKTLQDGTTEPLKIGDKLEINHHQAVVVGICRITQGFYPQPTLFTSYSNFLEFTDFANNRLDFIMIKVEKGQSVKAICEKINAIGGVRALTRDQFKWRIVQAFLKTGILINFGLSVLLAIIIGFSIAGQIFYMMTLSNIGYYALIKAIGGTEGMIFRMIAIQAIVMSAIGFILGIAATLLWGIAVKGTTLAFLFPWQLLVFSGSLTLLICLAIAALSIRKVFRVDPKILMGT